MSDFEVDVTTLPPLKNADLLREVEKASKNFEIFEWAQSLTYLEFLACKPVVTGMRQHIKYRPKI